MANVPLRSALALSALIGALAVAGGRDDAAAGTAQETPVNAAVESQAPQCAPASTRRYVGWEVGSSDMLESATAVGVNDICNAAPGMGTAWVDVNGEAAVRARVNNGYRAAGTVHVNVTLPEAPLPGDLVSIDGSGVGGWTIAQNDTQRIAAKRLPGTSWVARDMNRMWQSVASSADGSHLVAAAYGDQLFTSADAGRTWAARDSVRNWSGVASSADGNRLVASEDGGGLYTSLDAGQTWIARDASPRNWRAVASSTDGERLVAVASGDQIYTSADAGLTWLPREGNRNWSSVASSADGSRLVATAYDDNVYTSSDAGQTWMPHASPRVWQSVTSSADGQTLVAGESSGRLFVSTDAGATWAARDISGSWYGVAASADGSTIFAADASSTGRVFASTDSGAHWAERFGSHPARSIAVSSDGSGVAAVQAGGRIYTDTGGNTSVGAAGSLSGAQGDSVTLQYISSGRFIVVDYTSRAGGFTLQ